ncbi:MAG TPA: RNA 2',3'-cyclic phosphodiesterase [Polyangia bacterium]|nr:RNA 2',3'-cyclic phosphodiesterase [Polyangia bacterium]
MTTTVGVRSFVAVTLPPPVQVRVLAAAASLAPAFPQGVVRWSRKVENLHVTLKFLGNVAADRLEQLGQALVQRLQTVPPFAIAVRGFGAFPSPRAASIIWAGIDDPQQGLAGVAAIVGEVTASFGFVPEDRVFRGHVTVGRTREREVVDARAALASWSDHAFGDVAVGEVCIYESQLGREGSTYVLRCRAPLGERAPAPRGDQARPQ